MALRRRSSGRRCKTVGVTDRSIPGEQLIYKIYDLFGENRPSMEVTRRAVRFATGWVREQVQEAGKLAAETLADTVQPFAEPIFDEHRAAGRKRRARHDHALRPDQAAGRRARLRRRDRHPLRHGGRRHLRRHVRRRVRVGPGQAAGHRRVGQRARRRPGRELGLLRQLLRPADALGGRPPDRGEPRPPAASPWRWCGAGRSLHLDVPVGRAQAPIIGVEPQQIGLAFARPQLFPYVRFDINGVEHLP